MIILQQYHQRLLNMMYNRGTITSTDNENLHKDSLQHSSNELKSSQQLPVHTSCHQ